MARTSQKSRRAALERFEAAVDAYAFRGTIPAGESCAAYEAYHEVCIEYGRAKRAMLSLLDLPDEQFEED